MLSLKRRSYCARPLDQPLKPPDIHSGPSGCDPASLGCGSFALMQLVCAVEAAVCPGRFFWTCEVAAGKRVKPPASHAGSDPTAPLQCPPVVSWPWDELGQRECGNYMAVTDCEASRFGIESWTTRGPLPLQPWPVITASLYKDTMLFKA